MIPEYKKPRTVEAIRGFLSNNLVQAVWISTLAAHEYGFQNQQRRQPHSCFVAFFFSAHCSLGTFYFILPLSPAPRSGQWLFQEPPAESKVLAARRKQSPSSSGHRLVQGPPAESKVLAANPFFPRLRSGHRLFQGPPAESKVLAAICHVSNILQSLSLRPLCIHAGRCIFTRQELGKYSRCPGPC